MKSNDVLQHILILHDIRSAQNVGSLFRTADAAGISTIYLSPICPLPIDRFGRPVGAIAKTALGAELTMPWMTYDDLATLILQLQERGIKVIAIEQSPTSVDYKSISVDNSTAFIVGNEVSGLSQEILDMVDIIAEIPMHGSKESLNVAVTGGIALFRILDR